MGLLQGCRGRHSILTDCLPGSASPPTTSFQHRMHMYPRVVGGLGEGLATVSLSMLSIFHI